MLKSWVWAIFLYSVLAYELEGKPTKKGCAEREKSLALLELAKDSITKAKETIPECKDNSTQASNSSCGLKERTSAYLDVAMRLIEETKQRFPTCDIYVNPDEKPDDKESKEPLPVDCLEVQQRGHNKSGIYKILPGHSKAGNRPFDVFCDLEKNGGGWTVIQRRGAFSSPPVDFFRDWNTYKGGFGNISEEFWLGNENIYFLTNQTDSSAYIYMEDKTGIRNALYNKFSIEGETGMYKLHVKYHSGTAGDDLRHHNGMMFSTKDKKNDKQPAHYSCAVTGKSGWWFLNCSWCNLNGIREPPTSGSAAMYWYSWKRTTTSLKSVEIKLRRN